VFGLTAGDPGSSIEAAVKSHLPQATILHGERCDDTDEEPASCDERDRLREAALQECGMELQ
jgi:hypothetical protein